MRPLGRSLCDHKGFALEYNNMSSNSHNPYLPIIIDEISHGLTYHRFLGLMRDYGIEQIVDAHAHICSEKDFEIEDIPPRLIPKFPFTISDINHLYDVLFRSQGIAVTTVVFDTPLPAYNLAKKNDSLLNEMASDRQDNIVPFVMITSDMSTQQIEGYVKRGARGFKMTPRMASPGIKRGGFSDVTLVEMLNPEALHIADACRMPLVVHLPQLVVSPRMKPSLKDELLQIVGTYPQMKIILAHLGQAQTPAKIIDLLEWIEENRLSTSIWMDISAVTVPSVLEIALSSKINLLFGTDIDFSLTERGRYVMFKYSNGDRILADDGNNGNLITSLVSNSFGIQLREFAAENGIDLNAPMFVFQMEGILDAVERLRQKGAPKAEIAATLQNIFHRNGQAILNIR